MLCPSCSTPHERRRSITILTIPSPPFNVSSATVSRAPPRPRPHSRTIRPRGRWGARLPPLRRRARCSIPRTALSPAMRRPHPRGTASAASESPAGGRLSTTLQQLSGHEFDHSPPCFLPRTASLAGRSPLRSRCRPGSHRPDQQPPSTTITTGRWKSPIRGRSSPASSLVRTPTSTLQRH